MAGQGSRSRRICGAFRMRVSPRFSRVFRACKKVVSEMQVAQSNAPYGGMYVQRKSCRRFDTVRKRLLHSKGSHWTRVALVVRTQGLFRFSRQVGPTTTLDPFRQSVD